MKKIFIIILFLVFLCGCGNTKYQNNDSTTFYHDIMNNNEYIIIDVRTKSEYEEAHIIDAINIPYDEIDDSISKNKVIFVYCKSGNRSKIAFNTLKNLGYEVYDLGAFTEIDLPKE